MKKEDLRSGDVILFPPHKGDFIAWAIAFLTDGEVNHAALCYPNPAGELQVAESILKDGLVLNPFPQTINIDYPLRIARLKNQTDLTPVLKAAENYLNQKNSYPNFNLGLLGVLLLFKKFAPTTLQNKIIYQFAALVAVKLMKFIQQQKHPGHCPMSCSQFVAQCFTDAGTGYNLEFDKLVADFSATDSGSAPQAQLASTSNSDSTHSLFELLELESSSATLASAEAEDKDLMAPELNPEEEMQLTDAFIQAVKEETQPVAYLHAKRNGATDSAALSNLKLPSRKILFSLYTLMTGKKTNDLQEALKTIQSSTARNYFVSPQDIWANCPQSLEQVGLLSY